MINYDRGLAVPPRSWLPHDAHDRTADDPAAARKNPLCGRKSRRAAPNSRSRTAHGLTAAAAEGRFALQVCGDCGAAPYPPRDACRACLSHRLVWDVTMAGVNCCRHRAHIRRNCYFRERIPWRIGTVLLDRGVNVVAYLHGDGGGPRSSPDDRPSTAGRRRLSPCPSEAGSGDDPKLREMTCDPRLRKVLVTDGKSTVGQATVRALAAAGADLIWIGHAEPWKKVAGFEALCELPQATIVPLDVTDGRSVRELAGEIGGKVDILINTAEVHRTFDFAARRGVETAQLEMDVNYFGLLRLAQEFAPALKARAADGPMNSIAWVNVLSIFALANYPAHGTYSASKAAAYSLSQALRADLLHAGIRVINIFPGPIDDEWDQLELPPKLSPNALAAAMIAALKGSVEDVYPGDVAQDWLARHLDDPKALERELSEGGR